MLTKLEAARESTKADEDKAIVTSDLDLGVSSQPCHASSLSLALNSRSLLNSSTSRESKDTARQRPRRRSGEIKNLCPSPPPAKGWGIEDKTSLPANDDNSKF